jgi:hypothetical protein
MTMKKRKKYGLLSRNIAEFDTQSLGHGLCESGGTTSIYNKHTSQNTLSVCTHNDQVTISCYQKGKKDSLGELDGKI